MQLGIEVLTVLLSIWPIYIEFIIGTTVYYTLVTLPLLIDYTHLHNSSHTSPVDENFQISMSNSIKGNK